MLAFVQLDYICLCIYQIDETKTGQKITLTDNNGSIGHSLSPNQREYNIYNLQK